MTNIYNIVNDNKVKEGARVGALLEHIPMTMVGFTMEGTTTTEISTEEEDLLSKSCIKVKMNVNVTETAMVTENTDLDHMEEDKFPKSFKEALVKALGGEGFDVESWGDCN